MVVFRVRGRVNSAAGVARLLKQAKPVLGLLITGEICPPSASADGQGRAGEFTPRRCPKACTGCFAPHAPGTGSFFLPVVLLASVARGMWGFVEMKGIKELSPAERAEEGCGFGTARSEVSERGSTQICPPIPSVSPHLLCLARDRGCRI